MYCENCGSQMKDTAKFCTQCGVPRGGSVIAVTEKREVVNKRGEINREVLKQYLFDLRSMECIKEKLNARWSQQNQLVNSLAVPIDIKKPDRYFFESRGAWEICGIVLAVAAVILANVGEFVLGWLVGDGEVYDFFNGIAAFVGVLTGILAVVDILLGTTKCSSEMDMYRKALSDEEERLRYEAIRKNNESKVLEEIHLEYVQAGEILEKAYSVNIVPKQFRNIYAIYYLYDYISTSNEPLSAAILNCNLEEIKQQLSVIIEQQNQVIINQAIMLSQNEKMVKQNKRMIEQNEHIERNTQMGAEYAKIGAVYSEANAWIGLANYIKD